MRHKRCWPCDQEFFRRKGGNFGKKPRIHAGNIASPPKVAKPCESKICHIVEFRRFLKRMTMGPPNTTPNTRSSMNLSSSPSPSSPSPPHRHQALAKPLAVPLRRVGVAVVDNDQNFRLFVRDILEQGREFHCVGCYASGEAALIGIPQSGAQG